MTSHRHGCAPTASGCVHFQLDGEAEGLPLVLIHGFGGSAGVWEPMVDALALRRRVVRLDLPGHGQSERRARRYAVEEQAAAVYAALDCLEIPRAHVAAHSAGGDVLVAMLATDPSRIASAAFLGTAPDLSFVRLGLAARLMRLPVLGRILWALASDDALRRGLRQTFAARFGDVPDVYVRSLRAMTYDWYSNGISELETFKNRSDLCTRLSGVHLPMLVVFGSADQWVSPAAADRWAEATSARVERLPGVGHTPMAEAPDETCALILSFIDELEAAAL